MDMEFVETFTLDEFFDEYGSTFIKVRINIATKKVHFRYGEDKTNTGLVSKPFVSMIDELSEEELMKISSISLVKYEDDDGKEITNLMLHLSEAQYKDLLTFTKKTTKKRGK